MRKCSMCKEEKPVSEFGKHKNGKDGLRSRCKACNRVEARNSYEKNPAPYKRRARVCRKKIAVAMKEWLRGLKSKYGCCVCGEREVCVLDFHHVGDKDICVTTAISKGVKAVEQELHRSTIVCANCHRKIHANLIAEDALVLCADTYPRSPNRRMHLPTVKRVRRSRVV